MLAMNAYLKLFLLCILLVAFFVTGHFADSSRPDRSDWKKISPFTEVTFEGETIFAEYEGTVYKLSSIEKVESVDLVKAARREFGRQWQKRIREDIAEVLDAAGVTEERFVDLELIDPNTGAVKTVFDAEMTEENRSKIYNRS